MRYTTRNGWTIEFRKNIHMYYHSLKATKNGRTFDVPCEDTPGNFVGIWTYQLSLNSAESLRNATGRPRSRPKDKTLLYELALVSRLNLTGERSH